MKALKITSLASLFLCIISCNTKTYNIEDYTVSEYEEPFLIFGSSTIAIEQSVPYPLIFSADSTILASQGQLSSGINNHSYYLKNDSLYEVQVEVDDHYSNEHFVVKWLTNYYGIPDTNVSPPIWKTRDYTIHIDQYPTFYHFSVVYQTN